MRGPLTAGAVDRTMKVYNTLLSKYTDLSDPVERAKPFILCTYRMFLLVERPCLRRKINVCII
jgi:hypothetical protein